MNRKDYFKKRDNIMDNWVKGNISHEHRNNLMRELSLRYNPKWGNVLFEDTYSKEVR